MTLWDLPNPGHGIIDYAYEPIDGGQRATLVVWLLGAGYPDAGDDMILRHHRRDPLSETARYRVTRVHRPFNPRDVAFLDLVFHPRTAEEKRRAAERI